MKDNTERFTNPCKIGLVWEDGVPPHTTPAENALTAAKIDYELYRNTFYVEEENKRAAVQTINKIGYETDMDEMLYVTLKPLTPEDLFDGADRETLLTIDQRASVNRFESLWEDLILERFNAAISWNQTLRTDIYTRLGTDEDYANENYYETEAAAQREIRYLSEALFDRGEQWMVDINE